MLAVAVRLVRTQVGWARARLERIEKARADLATARREHAARLQEARTRAEEARAQAAAAREQREALQAELEELTPERLLDDLITQRLQTGAYRRHLGLLEQVRGDFETIVGYLGERARAMEGAATCEEEERLAGRGISRIVLYIDDLDRCDPQRVVEVLKAVHLLLSMKLFVVVVGVDVRWVSRALADRHPPLDGDDEGASPRDYLEKIFQIPFWIEPLDAGGSRRMLLQLLGPPRDGGSDDDGGEMTMTSTRAAGASPGASPPSVGNGGAPSSDPSGGDTPSPTAPGAAASLPGPVEARPEQLEIGPLERAFMERLSPLLGRSPRALKRFVNTYRIVKAREPDAAAFLSEDADVPAYRAVLFLLALTTGAPVLAAGFLDEVLGGRQGTVSATVEALAPRRPAEAERALAWLRSDDGGDWADVPVAQLGGWAAEAARFTFHWHGRGSLDPPIIRG